jgi:colanic acid/amylovoran biosynthesis glycosyltransferase
MTRMHWPRPVAWALVAANLRTLVRQPRSYLSAAWIVAGEWHVGPKRALKALAAFPLMVWMAYDMKAQGVTHVHAHFASYPALAALIINRLTGISYSFTAHAYDLYVRPSRLPEKVGASSFVIAISEFNRRLLEPHAVRTPVHVVHCGVDVPAEVRRYAPHEGQLLCVARLEEKKGHQYLIDACRILTERGVPVTCTCIGAGPLDASLRQRIADAGLSQCVTLAGARTLEEVQQALATSAVFVLPSVVTRTGNAEGIPVALMEAMAAGVPVVSTRITGIPELIEDGVSGLLVPQRDAQALADAIERLVSDRDLCERFRRAAFERVREEFRTEVSVAQVADYLRQAVSS